MDLKETAALRSADGHWYYVSKARMVEAHLAGRDLSILDVGAGAGWFSRYLLTSGVAGRAVCVDPGYSDEHDEDIAGRPLSFRRHVDSVDADVVLLMDVLEHVDDDVGLLASYVKMARPGTRFMITVPAFRFLWSAHDDYLEHRRRYTIGQLSETVRAAGLTELASHYYFASIFPAAAVVRLLRRGASADRSDMRQAPPWLNAALTRVLSAERTWMRANRLAGLSVVCLCRK